MLAGAARESPGEGALAQGVANGRAVSLYTEVVDPARLYLMREIQRRPGRGDDEVDAIATNTLRQSKALRRGEGVRGHLCMRIGNEYPPWAPPNTTLK